MIGTAQEEVDAAALADESIDLVVLPQHSQVVLGELEDGMKPFPEGERSFGQRILRELIPADNLIVALNLLLLLSGHF